MNEHEETKELAGDDRQLVDLVTAVDVDPNLHTDLRMRLHREITALLRATREDQYGLAGREVHQRALEAHSDHLPDLLTAVLVDPNLHTDMRMRLHREIPELLRTMHDRPVEHAEQQNLGQPVQPQRPPALTAQRPPTASPLSGVTVLDAMHPGVVTCLPDDGLATLAAIMVTHGIHAVALASLDRVAPLIVTDLELVRAALERADARAAEIAREPVASLPADAPLDQAVTMMAERYVAHLLATEPGSGAPVGIVSSFDVAAVLGGHEPRVARMLRPAPARPLVSARTLSQVRVGDAMHPGIATCPADALLSTVARSMAEHRVHCVAAAGIERPGQHLTWGLITDMDLVLALHRGALAQPAATIAATEPIAVDEDESLDRVAALMVEHGTSHIVVVGSSGLPSGIVSTHDVMGVLAANG